MERKMKKNRTSPIIIGMCVGVCVGVAMSILLGEYLSISVGAGAGTLIGMLCKYLKNKKSDVVESCENGSD